MNKAVTQREVATTQIRFRLNDTFTARTDEYGPDGPQLILEMPARELPYKEIREMLPEGMDEVLAEATVGKVADVLLNSSILNALSAARIKN